MHPALFTVVVAVSGATIVAARLHNALDEDLYAFPKYRVTFLNGFPVLNATAEHWLKNGLKGGELEFLEKTGASQTGAQKAFKSIDSGGVNGQVESATTVDTPPARLKLMRTSPNSTYLCLIPPPQQDFAQKSDEDERDPTPAQSWSLLQPLSGSCIYHRQPWWTFSYCHNHQVRQFRELPHSHPHPPGGYIPEEDPVLPAFTLGRAPSLPSDGSELTTAQQAALENSVELATSAGHRYLVQRWSDGTICDKTLKPRDIEIQFHCSITMTDTILFVKETKTCHYVMVIHTPRLCGEPGFKTRLEQRKESYIRCRQVVDTAENTDKSLLEASQPLTRRPRNPILGSPPLPRSPEKEKEDEASTAALNSASEVIRLAIEALFKGSTGSTGDTDKPRVDVSKGPNGELFIEFQDDGDFDEEELVGQIDSLVTEASGNLEEALRAAGIDVKGRKQKDPPAKKETKSTRKGGATPRPPAQPRDEL